jgi:pyroglutamyl-peptidase
MDMKILVTGFGPFGTLAANPSAAVVRRLAGRAALPDQDLVLAVLPTAYREAAKQVHELLVAEAPDVCLLLGVAEDTDELRLETVARNITTSLEPDVRGEVRAGREAVTGGSPDYRTTLPVKLLHARLTRAGLPARLSADAGGYVCNHVYYVACHTAARSSSPVSCGFVHLPGDWSTSRLLRGVEVCLDALLDTYPWHA